MSDIRETISNITKNVTKTSGDFLKTTKLGMNLSSEEGNLRNLHLEIGRKVHEIYQYGGSLGKFFDEKYLEIEACERKISEIKEQIAVIKGIRECPKCGKKIEKTSDFCSKCGIRLDYIPGGDPSEIRLENHPPAEYPPPAPASHSPPPPAKICRICKSENEPSTKFCLSCGRILD